jgi:transposase-like protein
LVGQLNSHCTSHDNRAGNVWKHPELIVPQMTDRTMLTPLFEKVHRAIRSVDDTVIIMYEPTVVPDTSKCATNLHIVAFVVILISRNE